MSQKYNKRKICINCGPIIRHTQRRIIEEDLIKKNLQIWGAKDSQYVDLVIMSLLLSTELKGMGREQLLEPRRRESCT